MADIKPRAPLVMVSDARDIQSFCGGGAAGAGLEVAAARAFRRRSASAFRAAWVLGVGWGLKPAPAFPAGWSAMRRA